MATLQCDSHPYRKVFDTLVVGYLNRQNYCESARCLLNESTTLRNIARLPDQSVAINDVVHGKHLEQIMQTFIERGDFEVGPVLFDFGNRLRALANEFIALTNADAYWSDAQRTLYGKRVPPSKSNSSEGPRSATQVIVYPNSAQQSMSCVGASNAHAIGYGSASTRRKSAHPVSTDTRRKEMLREMVEPVVHSAQQLISGAASSESSSPQTASSIPIDDNAIGVLERYIAHDNLEEIIASLERDMPPTFFDDAHLGDNFASTFSTDPICLPEEHTSSSCRGRQTQQAHSDENADESLPDNSECSHLKSSRISDASVEYRRAAEFNTTPAHVGCSSVTPQENVIAEEVGCSAGASVVLQGQNSHLYGRPDTEGNKDGNDSCGKGAVFSENAALRKAARELEVKHWMRGGRSEKTDKPLGQYSRCKGSHDADCFKESPRPNEGSEQLRKKLREERWSKEKAKFEKWKRKNDEEIMKIREENNKKENEEHELMLPQQQQSDNYRPEEKRETMDYEKRKEEEEGKLTGGVGQRKEDVGKIKGKEGRQRREAEKESSKEKMWIDEKVQLGSGGHNISGEDISRSCEERSSKDIGDVYEQERPSEKETEEKIKRREGKRIGQERRLKEEAERRKKEEKRARIKLEDEKRATGERDGVWKEEVERSRKAEEQRRREEEDRIRREEEEHHRKAEEARREEKEEFRKKSEEKRRKEEEECIRREEEDRRKKAEEERMTEADQIRREEEERCRKAEEKRMREEEERIRREEEEHRRNEEKRMREEEDRLRQEEEESRRKAKEGEEKRLREDAEKKMKLDGRREREEEERLEREKRKAEEEKRRAYEELRRRDDERRKKEDEEAFRKEQEELVRTEGEKRKTEEGVQEKAGERRRKDEGMRRREQERWERVEEKRRLEEEYRKHVEDNRKKEDEEIGGIEEECEVEEEQKLLTREAAGRSSDEEHFEEVHSEGLCMGEFQVLAPCEMEGRNLGDDEHVSTASASSSLTNGDSSPLKQSSEHAEEKEGRLQKREEGLARRLAVKKRKKCIGEEVKVDKKERRSSDEQRYKLSKEKTSKEREDKGKEVVDNEKKKKDRGERLRKEQEEVRKQLREQAEKERRRAIEREKRRQEENGDSEKEERERRRKEKEEREELERRRKEKELRGRPHQSKERSPKVKKKQNCEKSKEPGPRLSVEEKEGRRKFKEAGMGKEKVRPTSEGHIDLSYLFEERSSSPDTPSKRVKPKTKTLLQTPKESVKRRGSAPFTAADSLKGTKEPEKAVRRSDKRSISIAKSKGASRPNLFLDDLFSTFMAPPPKPGK
ncbi:unnamed protein product [Toxocara canis]|uniref:LisH domain-containing protein n=1 Tax=Toxocara canis TaxID=6265 RepID=A0A183UDR1_TOXCA|nr:unnamed protein product [Toxocara canis]